MTHLTRVVPLTKDEPVNLFDAIRYKVDTHHDHASFVGESFGAENIYAFL